MFLAPVGTETTLTEGAVEQIERFQQMTDLRDAFLQPDAVVVSLGDGEEVLR